MTIALLVIRLTLAAVLLIAGIAKLCDLAGSREALRQFGVPGPISRIGGVALPLFELIVAAALLPASTARWGAVGAMALFGAFAVAITRALRAGRRPDCRCFGQLHSAPAGVGTLARDLTLAGLALFIVVDRGHTAAPGALSWLGSLGGQQILGLAAGSVLAAAVAFLGWFCLQLLRQNGRLLARIEAIEGRLPGAAERPGLTPAAAVANGSGLGHPTGLTAGSPAPVIALPGPDGRTRTLEELRAGRPALVVFSDPACGPCDVLLPDVAGWQREHAERLAVVIVTRGASEVNRAKAERYGLESLLIQDGSEVSRAFGALGTPTAVLVSSDGLIASAVAGGPDAIRALMADALDKLEPGTMLDATGGGGGATVQHTSTPPVGARAPQFEIADLDRRPVRLRDYRGSKTLLLFWNPRCGFCQRMLPELQNWETSRGAGSPQLVVVSTGGVELNRTLNLRSSVLADESGEVMVAFGSAGTPMAVVIDAAGRIASPLLAGARAVMAAARQHDPAPALPG